MSAKTFLIALVLAVILVGAVYYLRQETPPPAEPARAPMTAEARLERGRYLVENVVHCFACHADVDWAGTGLAKAADKCMTRAFRFPFMRRTFLLTRKPARAPGPTSSSAGAAG